MLELGSAHPPEASEELRSSVPFSFPAPARTLLIRTSWISSWRHSSSSAPGARGQGGRCGKCTQNCLLEQPLFSPGLRGCKPRDTEVPQSMFSFPVGDRVCILPTKQVQPSKHCALCEVQSPGYSSSDSAGVDVWRGHEEFPEAQLATPGNPSPSALHPSKDCSCIPKPRWINVPSAQPRVSCHLWSCRTCFSWPRTHYLEENHLSIG